MDNLNENMISCPEFGYADLLEDAFKTPVYDEEGRSEPIPVIWEDYSYGETDEGILMLSSKSAMITSSLYSKYLDEEAIVWDAYHQRLVLYIPDPQCPKMGFKGGGWTCAKKLKDPKGVLGLADVYMATLHK